MKVLERLLAADLSEAASIRSVEQWRAERARRWRRWEQPIDVAIEGGFVADRLGVAFIGGYDAALHALWPTLPVATVAALCATEDKGAHPRAIRTRLAEGDDGRWRLDGHKRWVTGGELADCLIVIATTGEDDDGRPRLRAARVDARAEGLELAPSPAPPFVPEIPHCAIELRQVVVDELWPGDGYAEVLKPFRTIEDLHVHAALLAYQLGVARRANASRELCEALCAALAASRALAAADPSSPTTHLTLAGLLAETVRLRAELSSCWAHVDPAERQRWQRDQALLSVAQKARSQRRERAWQRLGHDRS
jgi:acyl-CoA dehydrogenase